jgi:hypothetical protein
MISSSALPLSQQVVAWLLQALGYGDDRTTRAYVSPGTLKNAEQAAVLRSWRELITAALSLLGSKPDEHLQAKAEAWLRAWDLKLGALPPAAALSLPERLHMPLARAIPEVGIRLGALAALLVVGTGRPAEQWMWLVDPFDTRFFGHVVQALFRYRRPDLKTIDEQGAALEGKGIINARTLERWYAGDLEAQPQICHLPGLGDFFGPGAEALLRLARLVCVLRRDLREWIGREDADDWMSLLGQVGRTAAMALLQPAVVAALLRWLGADLVAGSGEPLSAEAQGMLPLGARAESVQEVRDRLVAAALELEASAKIDHPCGRWAIGLTLIVPHPQLSVRICGIHDSAMLGWLPSMDFFRSIDADWTARSLVKTIAAGGTLPLTGSDGSREERPIPDQARDIARRWESTSLQFLARTDVLERAPELPELFHMLLQVLGKEAFMELTRGGEEGSPVPFHPAALFTVPEADAARTRSICLARARQLAERGDREGALQWKDRACLLGPPTTAAELEDLLATLAAIAHGVLDDARRARSYLRAVPDGVDLAPLRTPLLQIVQMAERIVATIMQIGAAPDGTNIQLTMLVSVIPVAIRIACLREELSIAHEGLEEQAINALVSQLRICLEQHHDHGRGLALVALWLRGSHPKDPGTVRKAERLAVHHGAGDFLESERTRLRADFG